MAKKKRNTDVNVSQEIRDILARDPDAKPAAIVKTLADRNIKVSAQYVSTIKCATRRREHSAVSAELHDLVLAKQFIKQVGGVEKALQLLRDYRALVE